MLGRFKLPSLTISRAGILNVGVLLFGLLFHFTVAKPKVKTAESYGEGMARLGRIFKGPSYNAAMLAGPSAKVPQHLFDPNHMPFGAPAEDQTRKSPTPDSAAGAGESTSGQQAIADPALLKLLQEALRERGDAEYIYRLRHFRRQLTPIQCPPLPSYSLKGIELSGREREIVECHERKQLQAQCIIPASLFEPMRCPTSYQWNLSEQIQEAERKWLADRTRKKG